MKRKTKLFLAGIIGVVANVIAISSASFAFFASIKARSNSADTIAVTQTDDILIKDLKILGYDTEEEKAIICTTEEGKPNYALPPFDSIIFQKNQYNQRFIRLDILYPNGVDTSGTKNLEIKILATGLYKKTDGYVGNSLSNFVEFAYYDNQYQTGLIDTSDLTTDEGIENAYNGCRSVFDGYGESDQNNFFHIPSSSVGFDTSSKTGDLSILVPLNTSSVKTVSGAKVSEIFLRFDYSRDLVENYKSYCCEGGLHDIKIFSKEEEELLKIVSDIPTIQFDIA